MKLAKEIEMEMKNTFVLCWSAKTREGVGPSLFHLHFRTFPCRKTDKKNHMQFERFPESVAVWPRALELSVCLADRGPRRGFAS